VVDDAWEGCSHRNVGHPDLSSLETLILAENDMTVPALFNRAFRWCFAFVSHPFRHAVSRCAPSVAAPQPVVHHAAAAARRVCVASLFRLRVLCLLRQSFISVPYRDYV
jgi:hypothetical protein